MGQFKPMVKMMTTEPSIELKLKKGGAVSHPKKMMNGGVMSGLAAAPSAAPARGGMAPARRPAAPSMAARRAAMMGRPMMKEGGETPKEHKAEMKALKGLKSELKSHEGKPASKAHKGLATGGVVMGQGGFKQGGKVKMAEGGVPKSGILPVAESERGGGKYVSTKMNTAEGEHHTPKKTGEVKMGNAGGYKKGGKACYAKGGGVEGNVSTTPPGVTNTTTGEVRKGNAGGFKKGGSAKKAFAAGGSVNDSGRPVAYPAKPVSKSVKNNLQSGTFKKGGSIKMNKGGIPAEAQSAIKQADAERAYRDYEKAEEAENKAMRDSILGAPKRMFEAAKGLFSGKEAPSGSVTKTEKSVTVTPSKKRGGSVKC
jgi:hypothetical protein